MAATYLIDVLQTFSDRFTGKGVPYGSTFKTTDYDRAMDIVERKIGRFAGVEHPKRKGKRIMIHQKFCYKIGGIETANMAIAKTFKSRNIVFVFGDADFNQVMELGKYHDVIIDDGKRTYDVDVAIFTNYDSAPSIIERVKAGKIYQQIHADFYALKQMKEWCNFVWKPSPRINKVISVSETAQKGLQRAFQTDSVVIPNILVKRPTERPVTFLYLSRATPEKGVDRLVKLLKRFDNAGKDYVLLLCSSIEQAGDREQVYLRQNPRVITIKPTIYTRELMRAADWGLQLSYNESYCYAVREMLQEGVPCICSGCPELIKLIEDGKNGYIHHEGDDIERYFKKKLKPEPREEDVSPLWEEVLNGKL